MKLSKLIRPIVISLLIFWIVLIPLLIFYNFSNSIVNSISLIDLFILIILYFKRNLRKFVVLNLFTILSIIFLIFIFSNSAYTTYLYAALVIEILVLALLLIRKHVKKELILSDKILKFIILIIPFIIILYLLYTNIAPFGKEINNFYDIGKDNVLTPKTRISQNIIEEESNLNQQGSLIIKDSINYVNQTDSLVYLDSKVPWGADSVKFEIKFKNSFPEDSQLLKIGAKDREEWHYEYKLVYNPILDNLNFIQNGSMRLYQLKGNNYNTVNEFLNNLPKSSVIATDQDLETKDNKIDNYAPNDIEITNAIRGSATMYVYAKGDIKLEISKFDINWYEGEDPLDIYVYNSKNELVGNTTIPDDGITDNSKKLGELQTKDLKIENITEGVYKILLKGTSDTIIKDIKINQNKVVFEGNLLLADNQAYNLTEKESDIYTKTSKNSYLTFLTYHNQGIQNITINNNILNINKPQTEFDYSLTSSNDFYEIKIPKNDLVINTVNYISFSRDAYFEPYAYKIVSIANNETLLKKNANYILTDYQKPMIDGDWIIGKAQFNIKDLYINNNKIQFLINIPHLGNEQYKNYTIPIDYISITYTKEPIWK